MAISASSLRLTVVFAALAVALAARSSRADVTFTQTEGDDTPTVIRLTVTPAAEAVPALRHRLIARDIDLKPGNAAPYYYRAIMQLPRANEALNKEFGEEWDQWHQTGAGATAISALPLEKVRKAIEMSRFPIEEQLFDAVNRRDCDWQLGEQDLHGAEIISFLLPEMQESRSLTRLLALRTRLAIAENRYDDAINSMRMNYRLATDTAQMPILVCGLVGIAEAGMVNGTAIELIAAANSPNLYWALSELPRPLIDLRMAARFELGFPERIFPFIHHAQAADHSPEEWNQLFKQSLRDLPKVTGGNSNMPNHEIAATLAALAGYSHAKARLIEKGMERDRVEQMAVGQVIAIYTEQVCDQLSDEYEKLWYVPFQEMNSRLPELERKLAASRILHGGPDREVLPIMSLLLPSVQAVRQSQVRLEREVAGLRVIEAVRMYAATHDRKLPANLNDIKEVPVPLNPATGQPFSYRLDGNMAILELPASDGIRNQSLRCEIRIAP